MCEVTKLNRTAQKIELEKPNENESQKQSSSEARKKQLLHIGILIGPEVYMVSLIDDQMLTLLERNYFH